MSKADYFAQVKLRKRKALRAAIECQG